MVSNTSFMTSYRTSKLSKRKSFEIFWYEKEILCQSVNMICWGIWPKSRQNSVEEQTLSQDQRFRQAFHKWVQWELKIRANCFYSYHGQTMTRSKIKAQLLTLTSVKAFWLTIVIFLLWCKLNILMGRASFWQEWDEKLMLALKILKP